MTELLDWALTLPCFTCVPEMLHRTYACEMRPSVLNVFCSCDMAGRRSCWRPLTKVLAGLQTLQPPGQAPFVSPLVFKHDVRP